MGSATLGVKIDDSVRGRLKQASAQLGRSPHWLHKQALLSYIDQIEQGNVPQEVSTESRGRHVGRNRGNGQGNTTQFLEFSQDIRPQSVLRAAITSAYRRAEPECLPFLLEHARVPEPDKVRALAAKLVTALRGKRAGRGVESLVQEFSLSTQEGVALMCLAEALLRIPDRATRDALIRDKISTGDWKAHTGGSSSLFVNAATWGLVLTGKLVGVNSELSLSNALTRLIAKGGEPLIRRGVNIAMRMMGEQFVSGQNISEAIANNRKMEARGFRYSYDMLGEAAITAADAQRYYASYEQAIHAIGKAGAGRGIYEGPGISIKLSALHPRYSRSQYDRVMSELYPRLLALTTLACSYGIGINIDAEESDRLEISLDMLEALCFEPSLKGWNGIGFVIQAYQKRAPFVIDYMIELARRSRHRLMVRLVKGAYWDTEIKRAQVSGLEGYPVYTRKIYTDVSFLACARKLLDAPDAVFPQFATHNAFTVAAVYQMAGRDYYPGQYEFQCLHGMGESLYGEVIGSSGLNRPCRIYAPVGTYETLLAYLVRRLLENGANTSFVHLIGLENVTVEQLVSDPVEAAKEIVPLGAPHEKIRIPRDLYGTAAFGGRLNSHGIDLSNEHRLGSLSAALLARSGKFWTAGPMIGGTENIWDESRARNVINPSDHRDIVGYVVEANEDDVRKALERAAIAAPIWQSTPVVERVRCLNRAAQMLEERMQALLGLIVLESGKSIPNAIAEIREAIDFLRYYAAQIEREFDNETHRPLGIVVCISPWDLPLAIFLGQVAAALAAGNAVIAKPAEQTPLIAAQAIGILHAAGMPPSVVQLLPGQGATVGHALVSAATVSGVMFTGSNDVARRVACCLSERLSDVGHTIPFIAETGGRNVMIVDSSALPEQVVIDVLESAFDSAGQRCSALKVLCLQEECADNIVSRLIGAMHELRVGRPDKLSVDVGPIIDAEIKANVEQHIEFMRAKGHRVVQVELPEDASYGTFVPLTLIEIDSMDVLENEISGPVLHVLRYRREGLSTLIQDINKMGHGLTFGVHTRIDEMVACVTSGVFAGNIYVNRNMAGAAAGVQPFGGERLSGTGPKAGGPLYLYRLLSVRPLGLSVSVGFPGGRSSAQEFPGPTGESNSYVLRPRGRVLCHGCSESGIRAQWQACRETGNKALFVDTYFARSFVRGLDEAEKDYASLVCDSHLDETAFDAVLFEGDSDALRELNCRIVLRPGPLVSVQGLSTEAILSGERYAPEVLLVERSVSVNTAAAGGNASLMTIG